jgi:hypothetical protein
MVQLPSVEELKLIIANDRELLKNEEWIMKNEK